MFGCCEREKEALRQPLPNQLSLDVDLSQFYLSIVLSTSIPIQRELRSRSIHLSQCKILRKQTTSIFCIVGFIKIRKILVYFRNIKAKYIKLSFQISGTVKHNC